MNNIDVLELEKFLSSGTRADLEQFCSQNGLKIQDNKIIAQDQKAVNEAVRYWDKRQLVTKISLNSLYGAILNSGCRFFDKRIGQSTTLTGRWITRHMAAETNRMLTGEYDHQGKTIVYGDSVTGDSLLYLQDGSRIKIEDLYDQIDHKVIQDGGKEYAVPTEADGDVKVLGYDSYNDEDVAGEIHYVMRHKVKKKLYKITTSSGKEVTVTEDHSIIIDRDGYMTEVTPLDLQEGDLVITVS